MYSGGGSEENLYNASSYEIDAVNLDTIASDALVSVIMPAYNSSEYISESINSVLHQTYQNWELIIIDDHSTDNTVDIVKEYCSRDPRVKLVVSEANNGVAAARNIGLQVAKGKYIAFLDSDDLWLPDKLKIQLSFMEKNHVAFSFSSYERFDSENKEKRAIVKAPEIITANDVLTNTVIGCLTVMVNKELVGNFRMPLLNHMEDNATWYTILSRGFTAYGLPTILARYRLHGKSLTQNKMKAAYNQWKVYRNYFLFNRIQSIQCFIKYGSNSLRRYLGYGG